MSVPLNGGTARAVAPGKWFDLSPDGKFLATTSNDGARQLRVLSTESLRELHRFPLPAEASGWIAFSADGKDVFYVC